MYMSDHDDDGEPEAAERRVKYIVQEMTRSEVLRGLAQNARLLVRLEPNETKPAIRIRPNNGRA